MNWKEITTQIIAVLIILAAIASLFLTVNQTGEQLIQSLALLVIGFYFGKGTVPLAAAFRK